MNILKLFYISPLMFLIGCSSVEEISLRGVKTVPTREEATTGPKEPSTNWIRVDLNAGYNLLKKIEEKEVPFGAYFSDCGNESIYIDEFYIDKRPIDELKFGRRWYSGIYKSKNIIIYTYINPIKYRSYTKICLQGNGQSMTAYQIKSNQVRIK